MRHLALAAIALTATLLLTKKTGYKFGDCGEMFHDNGQGNAKKHEKHIKYSIPFLLGVFVGELIEFAVALRR